MHRIRNRKSGFTLIELLVVMAIIAVLAGLVFPGLKAARNSAKKAAAGEEAKSLETAVKSYYLEYSRYPEGNDSGSDTEYIGDNASLMGVLMGDNDKKIVFMEIDDDAAETSGNSISFIDPWGNPYNIVVDTDFDNELTVLGEKLKRKVAVWSLGPDGTSGSEDDYIKSW